MKRLLTLLPYLICLVAIVLVWRELRGVSLAELMDEVRARRPERIALAFGLLAVNFVVMSLYDFIALKQLGERLPFMVVFATSVRSFAITNLVSHSILTGLALRVRAYGRFGLDLSKITQITVMNVESWWMGFLFLCGLVLVRVPLDDLRAYSVLLTGGGGLLLLSLTGVYLIACTVMSGRVVRVKRFEIYLPSFTSALQKLVVATLDTALVSLTLYVLMPSDLNIEFPQFMALHLTAHFLGVITMVPGGLGVLEGVLLKLLEPYGRTSAILASILLFRVIHYLVPAALAVVWMSARDLGRALTKSGADQ